MKLQPGKAIDEFIELTFRPGSWENSGIPQSGCRIRSAQLDKLLDDGGTYTHDDLIYGLMDWLDVTDDPLPSLPVLRALLDRHYPDDGKARARCVFAEPNGPRFVFHTARTIDLSGPVVAWQRKQWVIAAACANAEPTRMTVVAPAPVSLRVAQSILNHSMPSFMEKPYDSYRGLQDTSTRTGSYYSWAAGEATLVSWEYGLGLTERDGRVEPDPEFESPPADNWLAPNQLAMQVGIAAGYAR